MHGSQKGRLMHGYIEWAQRGHLALLWCICPTAEPLGVQGVIPETRRPKLPKDV